MLNLDQLLAEMETEDYSNIPLNCTSGEEYEEWLRCGDYIPDNEEIKEAQSHYDEGGRHIRKYKLQRLNSLNYQALKLLESYNDIFNGNYGLAIEYGNFLVTIGVLIEQEEVE